MATMILVVVLIITSVLAYPINARSLISTKAKAKTSADEQNEYYQHPLLPFFGSFGGLRGAIRPPFGLGVGIGGFGGSIGGGFGPFTGNGGTSSAGAGAGAGTGTGFGSSVNEGFGDNSGGNNPNDKIEGELDAGDLGEGVDVAIKNDMHHH